MNRNWAKNKLSEKGIFPALDLLRRLPEIRAWLVGGSTGIAPAPVKRMIIRSYLRRFRLREFVETGTHLGDTLAYVARDRDVRCTSIELSPSLHRAAEERFRNWENVAVLQGDSGELLAGVLGRLQRPGLFWLDGHYSGAGTAKGASDSPVERELDIIMASAIRGHVVLIDDARCFTGEGGYPQLDELLRTVRLTSRYHAEVSADIIRLTPDMPSAALHETEQ